MSLCQARVQEGATLVGRGCRAVGVRLRELRKSQSLTQAGLAGLCGLSQQHVSLLEAGDAGAHLATLSKILDALGYRLAFEKAPVAAPPPLTRRLAEWTRFEERAALLDCPPQPLRVVLARIAAWRRRLGRVSVRVCAPEDLIVHKVLSERPKDLEDVRGIVKTQGKKLDRAYLDPLVKGLAEDLARPRIWEFYLSCWGTPRRRK